MEAVPGGPGRRRTAAAAAARGGPADAAGATGGAAAATTRTTTKTTTTLFHRRHLPRGCLDGNHRRSLPAPAFAFQAQRRGRVDLRALNRLDVERIEAAADVDALQHHLENLAFASLSEEDVVAHSDQAVVKAFRLAQLTIEYLLHVQDSLAEQLDRVAAQYACRLRRAAQLKSSVCKRDEAIALLKKHLRRQRRSVSVLAAAAEEADPIMPRGKAVTAAAAEAGAEGAIQRSSKLRLYVTLPDGACAGVLASPLMPIHELKRQVLPDLLSALSPGSTPLSLQKFRLAYRGVRLGDDKTLRELQMPDEASLVCILTPTGSSTTHYKSSRNQQGVGQEEEEGARRKVEQEEKEREQAKAEAEEERRLAEQERALAAIERRLADFEGHVLSFLERQRAEMMAETGHLWERLPSPEPAPTPMPAPVPGPAPAPVPLDGSASRPKDPPSSAAAAKPRCPRPPQKQQSQASPPAVAAPCSAPLGWDIEARVRALLDAVEARVRAKVRRKRVVGSADMAQIKELQQLLQAELARLDQQGDHRGGVEGGDGDEELRARAMRLEARRVCLPGHVQALLAKIQAAAEGSIAAAAAEGEGEGEAGPPPAAPTAAASTSRSNGGSRGRSASASGRRLSAASASSSSSSRPAASKPPKQRMPPSAAPPLAAAAAPSPSPVPSAHALGEKASLPPENQQPEQHDYDLGEAQTVASISSLASSLPAALPAAAASPPPPAASPSIVQEGDGDQDAESEVEEIEEEEEVGSGQSGGSGQPPQQPLQQHRQSQPHDGDDDEEEDEEASLVTIEEEEGLEGSQQGHGRRGSVHFGRGWSAALP